MRVRCRPIKNGIYGEVVSIGGEGEQILRWLSALSFPLWPEKDRPTNGLAYIVAVVVGWRGVAKAVFFGQLWFLLEGESDERVPYGCRKMGKLILIKIDAWWFEVVIFSQMCVLSDWWTGVKIFVANWISNILEIFNPKIEFMIKLFCIVHCVIEHRTNTKLCKCFTKNKKFNLLHFYI